jgi:peptidoglycan/LPS O-acetylase OafA/YrhL
MNAPAGTDRRHDLDALRAVAMLLGIVLHASLSFCDVPWLVQDTQRNAGLGIVFGLIHGFRMPVFFVMSGFFTAMLWRKRGLTSLLRHRVRRVLLPFILGLFTIVPVTQLSFFAAATNFSFSVATVPTEFSSPSERRRLNFSKAAKTGDIEALKHYLSNGESPNARDPSFGVTALSWAALEGRAEIVELLIEAGADVNAKNRDGATPLHAAAFMGQLEVAQLLLENGADISAKTYNGDTPLDSAQAAWKDVEAIAGVLQISLDSKDVKAGRVQVVELLQEQEIQRSDSDEVKTKGAISIGTWVWFFLTRSEILAHLWFLWYLCWFVVAFALFTTVANRMGWARRFQKVILPWSRYLWLIPLTMLPQWFMGNRGELPHFGPDLSANILPKPHMLLYYALFFFFGALYYDCNDDVGKVGKRWAFTLPVVLLIVSPIGLVFGWSPFPSAPNHVISVVAQPLFAWMMVFSLMGAFRQLVVKGSAVWRYVSDSSYWLYLAHLPLIVLAQGLIRPWQLPALLKFSLLCIVTTAILLVTYEYLVRYTPVGTLLNGPRRRPQKVVG